MKKVLLVLVLGMIGFSFVSCTKDEIKPSLIEVMENQEYYQEVGNDRGLRVVSETRIYTLIRDVSRPSCHYEVRLGYARYNVITSDEDTFSYRARKDDRTVCQYAFRSDDNGDSLRLTIYSYDEVEEEHTLVNEFEYLKPIVDFNICN